MPLKLITAPASEPITVAEAKSHLYVTTSDDDTKITGMIVTARQSAEHLLSRSLMPQTWELALDEFPRAGAQMAGDLRRRYASDKIAIPMPPFVSITSVKYLDDAGEWQTMDEADYLLDTHSEPARLMPAYGASWPTTRDQSNAVLIRYAAGYANAAAVPYKIKSWMLLLIGLLYQNRESVVAGISIAELPHVDRLLDAYRVWGV